MDTKPRFTLLAILGCTAVLCVPLAMIAAEQRLGLIFLFPVAGGCLGYLLAGKNGVMDGAIYGAVVMALVVVLVVVMGLRPN